MPSPPQGVHNALLRGTIELKRAELIRRALNTAVGNFKRVKFDLHSHEMVREIPNYPAPPIEEVDEAAEAARRANRPESARVTAAYLAECRAEPEKQSPRAGAKNGNPTNATPTHGNMNRVTPSTQRLVGGQPKCHRFMWGQPPPAVQAAQNYRAAAPAKVIARKPSASVKAEALRERKPAAHRASFSRN
jgi:hypothetical protein